MGFLNNPLMLRLTGKPAVYQLIAFGHVNNKKVKRQTCREAGTESQWVFAMRCHQYKDGRVALNDFIDVIGILRGLPKVTFG